MALRPFQLIVGPNASGKSTLLEILSLLGQIMRRRGDVREAISSIAPAFHDLLWRGEGDGFVLSVVATLPVWLRARLDGQAGSFDAVEYQLGVSLNQASNELGIDRELLRLLRTSTIELEGHHDSISELDYEPSLKLIVRYRGGDNVASYFPDEGDDPSDQQLFGAFRTRLDARTSALQATPTDDRGYSVANWFRSLLVDGIRRIDLDDGTLAAPSPPGLGPLLLPDGANLPKVVAALREDSSRFEAWLRHVRSALPDLKDIESIEREEDRASYLKLTYDNGARVPSWLVSAGTLRLLALTVLPYLETDGVVYLVEEPETGIHPRALEAVMESLRSVYGGQVLATTHSLLTVDGVEVDELLCASRGDEGETVLVAGPDHPVLRRRSPGGSSLGTLFASGSLAPLP